MLHRKHRLMLLGATLLAAAGSATAIAQVSASVYDPAQMPELHGKVAQYDLTPRGDVDGLILEDGTEVHFPPHLGVELVAAVRPGEAVTIHGLRARSVPLVQAMSIMGDTTGKTVVDNGPPRGDHGPGPGFGPHPGPRPPHGGPGQELGAQGVVKMQLHGPRGEMNGVLLADGTIVHLPPPEAQRLGAQLKPGDTVVVRGDGVETGLGRSIEARAIGASEQALTQIAGPPHGPRGPRPPGGPDAPPPGGPGAPPRG